MSCYENEQGGDIGPLLAVIFSAHGVSPAVRAGLLALRAEGKTVACWNEDNLPQKLAFLDPDEVIQKPRGGQSFDCVIATDCASFERLGTVGREWAGSGAIRLLDIDGREVPDGQVGELYARNSTLISGYHGNDAATSEAQRDGFTVPIPDAELPRVKKMSMAARIRWAKKQAGRR